MKRILILLLILPLFFESFSQIDFEPQESISKVSDARLLGGTTAADLDGDGDLDIVSASAENIIWYENEDGNGSYGEMKIIHTALENKRHVHTIDVDNDNDMDVVVIGYSEIFWYENLDGLGNFGDKNLIGTGLDNPKDLINGDLDGDGFMDLLVPDRDLDRVIWYRNVDGTGDFSEINIGGSTLGSPTSARIADIDGDGNLDVVVGGGDFFSSQRVVWYRNQDGLGSFSGPITIEANINRPECMAVADVDNDGDIDVIIGINSSTLYWFENNNGGFGERKYLGSLNNVVPLLVEMIDMDSDGDQDVVAAGRYLQNRGLFWYENLDGQGDFGDRIVLAQSKDVITILPADINGDSHLDLLLGTRHDDQIAWQENLNNEGNFSAPNIITVSDLKSPEQVQRIDWDMDGDIDIFTSSGPDWKTGWYENEDGLGTYGNFQLLDVDYYGAGSVRVVDVDNDGDLDYTRTGGYNTDRSYLRWKENLGGVANFSDANGVASVNFYEILDFDGDNDIDFISGVDDLVNGVSFHENVDGQGDFEDRWLFTLGDDEPVYLHPGDVDEDGDYDIIYAEDNGELSWRRQITLSDFSSRILIYGQVDFVVATLDIDGDNYLDIFFKKNNLLFRYEYNPDSGLFEEVSSFSTTVSDEARFADIDNDGDLDLVDFIASSYYVTDIGNVIWHLNEDGIGTFGPQQASPRMIEKPDDGFFIDIDLDGDIDLIANLGLQSRVVLYENVAPIPLSILDLSFTTIDCVSSQLEIIPRGGAAPYSYSLDSVNFQTDNYFELMVGDTVMVFLRDSEGVITSRNQVIVVNPNAPELELEISNNDVTIFAINGMPAYTYSIDGVTFQNSGAFTDLEPGDYTAILMDDLGCTGTMNFSITYTNLNIVQITIQPIDCDRSEIQIEPMGGNPPYQYSIDGSDYQNNNFFEVSVGSNLNAYLRDADGLVVSITDYQIPVPEKPELSVDIEDQNATLIASNGTPGYIYSINGIDFQPSNTFFDLESGDYIATVIDSLGCIVSTNFTISTTATTAVSAISFDCSILPNPSNGNFQLLIKNPLDNTVHLKVYDIQTKILFEKNLSLIPNTEMYPVGLSHLKSGLYLMQLQSKNIKIEKRLIIID